jgi:5-amino-6-(5-phospho-D-ribitylamino)uracil phosphatase
LLERKRVAGRREQYLFGIDLDGTTLDPSGEVTPRTREAIHAVLAAGHKVAFATGRNFIEARQVFEAVGHLDLCVLVSGAFVVDARNGATVHRSTMDPTLAADLCAAIERLGHPAVAYQDRAFTGIDYLVSSGRDLHVALSSWLGLSGQVIERRPALSEIDHTHTLRVSTVLDYAPAAELMAVVENEFGKRAYVHGIVVASEGVEIIEMFDPHVNKWQGLQRVADAHGVPHERIVAIGDDMNDIAMLEHSRFGTAMGNARTDVKRVAKRVIGSNAEDGLSAFLEEWV